MLVVTAVTIPPECFVCRSHLHLTLYKNMPNCLICRYTVYNVLLLDVYGDIVN